MNRNEIVYAMLYKTAAGGSIEPLGVRHRLRRIVRLLTPPMVGLGILHMYHTVRSWIDKRHFEKVLEEVMKEPSIARYPKEQVRRYAETFYELNPDLATKAEVLKTFLRSALAMQGIDPGFASKVVQRTKPPIDISVPLGPIIAQKLFGSMGS